MFGYPWAQRWLSGWGNTVSACGWRIQVLLNLMKNAGFTLREIEIEAGQTLQVWQEGDYYHHLRRRRVALCNDCLKWGTRRLRADFTKRKSRRKPPRSNRDEDLNRKQIGKNKWASSSLASWRTLQIHSQGFEQIILRMRWGVGSQHRSHGPNINVVGR